jgi:uncharacterized protein YcbK (DUF882 family)
MNYFEYKEFDSPDLPNSGKLYMDEQFMELLDHARAIAGIPFKINSAYRSIEINKKAGGKINSAHLVGKAADISCTDSRSRHIILSSLLDAGFNRIGIGATFIHVDSSNSKDSNVIWTY